MLILQLAKLENALSLRVSASNGLKVQVFYWRQMKFKKFSKGFNHSFKSIIKLIKTIKINDCDNYSELINNFYNFIDNLDKIADEINEYSGSSDSYYVMGINCFIQYFECEVESFEYAFSEERNINVFISKMYWITEQFKEQKFGSKKEFNKFVKNFKKISLLFN